MTLSEQRAGAAVSARSGVAEPVIEIAGLVKRYGTFTAVDHVDLVVERGEVFGILGPNGAGKTTTIEMIEGLRSPDEGRIRVAGIDVQRDPTAVKKIIGVQLQSTALFDNLSGRELIRLFAALYGADASPGRVDQLIEMVSLEEKAGAYVNQLSGGQQQRLSIALAMVNDPAIMFLDEPTTGLDPQARHNLWDVIRTVQRSGKTIVLTTHYMDEAESLCDRVAVMDRGRIIACDTPRNLIDALDLPSTIHLRLRDEALPDWALRALPDVISLEEREGVLEIRTVDTAATISALFDLARQHGTGIDTLSTSSPTLEDVFLHLTGRSLRE